VFFLGALRVARGASRRALVAVAAVSLIVPILLSLVSMRTAGLIWQGRYGLPVSAGGFLLAGWAWQRFGVSPRPAALLLPLATVMLAGATIASVGGLAISERHRPASAGDPGWLAGPVWLVVALALLGWVAYALTLRTDRTGDAP
ncbi:MAG: hypothetical protein M3Y66_07690, partial [Actinomycetota bacterium]|nr:hypothetical protein [Actinomycetota bacterium]